MFVEEFGLALALSEHCVARDANHLHDQRKLVVLVFAREDRVSHCELSHDAAEAPHVDAGRVRDAKDDLRRAVKPTLDVSVHPLILKTGAAKVDDFDAGLRRVFEQNVLRLEVAVNDIVLFQILECIQ